MMVQNIFYRRFLFSTHRKWYIVLRVDLIGGRVKISLFKYYNKFSDIRILCEEALLLLDKE